MVLFSLESLLFFTDAPAGTRAPRLGSFSLGALFFSLRRRWFFPFHYSFPSSFLAVCTFVKTCSLSYFFGEICWLIHT
ncbi:hypothetical protein BDD12DRAFT_19044 [Trichophaea hybrida]|nr:hypothetical protein BDD12DRAFT_19044 [Trichophaea hybrida]